MTEVEKALRITVYGGLLGSLFATIGWLLWLGLHVSHEHWVELIASAVVGAGVGWSYEWLQHYAHAARREQFGELSPIEDTRPDRLRPPRYFRAIFTGAAFGFLFCEHFISELATAVLVPFLVSLVTLFAAGACFALAFCNRNTSLKNRSFVRRVNFGLLVGMGTAIVLTLLGIAIGSIQLTASSVQLEASMAWWSLTGLGISLVVDDDMDDDWSWLGPLIGVLIAIVILFITCFTSMTLVHPKLADALLRGADVPSTFWENAENEIRKEEGSHNAEYSPKSHLESLERENFLTKLLGCPAPVSDSDVRLIIPVQNPGGILRNDDSSNGSFVKHFKKYSANGSFDQHFKEYKEIQLGGPEGRKMALCEQLSYGLDSALARSWIVLCFFSIGLGLAPRIERQLRPRDYAASETRIRDRRLSFRFIPFLILLAAVLIWTHDRWIHYFMKDNSATSAATSINPDQQHHILFPVGLRRH